MENVRILEAECCADHIHMLLEIPPKMSVSSFMGYLKGKSSLMLLRAVWGFKIQIQEQGVLRRGYYVSIRWVKQPRRRQADYIKHQLEEDKMGEQLSIL
ncbi:IS200/IS605 family transposase [Salmonella enterica subsp. enterica]|nr:IS200/IS605 family transposase [Salmonella enterica subsp. enterica]